MTRDRRANSPVMLLGPTASGKSAIAMRLAGELPLEIVSVDSAQVYRGMDVGTAKPTPEERARVAHHLVDIADPLESYSAARFAADARRLVDEIRARGRMPLLAGGTMLYAKAFAEGLHDLPAADAAVRAEIENEAAVKGWPAMHRELARVDAATAARLDPNDAQRIQRALEVHRLAGRPLSEILAKRSRPFEGERVPVIALEPSERGALHRRIESRLRAMLEHGFVEEVARLRERPGIHAALPSMRCVGYRQVWEFLDGRYDRETMIERAVAATRQLAKRQLTWLRSMRERVVVDCLAPDAFERVRAAVFATNPNRGGP